MKLSAIIPIKNEEKFLPNCLKSVSFVDEIVIVDSGSTDKSVALAKQSGAKVFKYSWRGFSRAHNFGAKKATGDWLLFIDADERVSRTLRLQIKEELKHPQADAYQIPRKNFILGKSLKHGGWHPDLVTRLIKKSTLDKWIGELHEYPKISGKTGKLSGEIYHLSHRGINWMLKKTIIYTKISAEILHKNNHPKVTFKNFFGSMAREFYYRAIKKSGWKDGFIGWLEIIYQTFNAFLIQVQLWELQRGKSMEQLYSQIDQEIASEL